MSEPTTVDATDTEEPTETPAQPEDEKPVVEYRHGLPVRRKR
jgi:hypothetical protein